MLYRDRWMHVSVIDFKRRRFCGECVSNNAEPWFVIKQLLKLRKIGEKSAWYDEKLIDPSVRTSIHMVVGGQYLVAEEDGLRAMSKQLTVWQPPKPKLLDNDTMRVLQRAREIAERIPARSMSPPPTPKRRPNWMTFIGL